MARIRTIKPEFWDDEKLSTLPMGCRLLFIGIWNFADDAGVIRSNEKFIKSKVFPYDETLRNSEVKKWLDVLENAQMLIPVSYNSESYYIVRTFSDHQRIDIRYKKHVIPEDVVNQAIKDHNVTTQRPQRDHVGDTPQERKGEERKGEEGTFTPPPLSDVISYFRENGYTEQAAKKAFQYYDTAQWKDSKGNKVKNWKQKMIAVWFKDENKIKVNHTEGGVPTRQL